MRFPEDKVYEIVKNGILVVCAELRNNLNIIKIHPPEASRMIPTQIFQLATISYLTFLPIMISNRTLWSYYRYDTSQLSEYLK